MSVLFAHRVHDHYLASLPGLPQSIDGNPTGPLVESEYPGVGEGHAAPDLFPAEIPAHPLSASLTHPLEILSLHAHGSVESFVQGCFTQPDPPAALIGLEALPWCSVTHYGRDTMRECFCYDKTEILRLSGEHK